MPRASWAYEAYGWDDAVLRQRLREQVGVYYGQRFYTLAARRRTSEIEHWRQEYNGFRPHSSLQNLTPDEVVAAATTVELQHCLMLHF